MVSRQFFSRTTGQGLPSMECAAYGGAVADAGARWPAPRSACRQSGVKAAAVHKRINRSPTYETRHRVLFLFIVFLQQFQYLFYFPCRIMVATVKS
jgi:hypothetical protein